MDGVGAGGGSVRGRRPLGPIACLLLTALLGACSGKEPVSPEYRRLEVPAARLDSEAARTRGRGLYLEHCALCHGEQADGHGPRSSYLQSTPRNYGDPTWRARVGPRYVFQVIREGVPGTAMPAWPTLDDDQTWDLAAYVLSVAEHGP